MYYKTTTRKKNFFSCVVGPISFSMLQTIQATSCFSPNTQGENTENTLSLHLLPHLFYQGFQMMHHGCIMDDSGALTILSTLPRTGWVKIEGPSILALARHTIAHTCTQMHITMSNCDDISSTPSGMWYLVTNPLLNLWVKCGKLHHVAPTPVPVPLLSPTYAGVQKKASRGPQITTSSERCVHKCAHGRYVLDVPDIPYLCTVDLIEGGDENNMVHVATRNVQDTRDHLDRNSSTRPPNVHVR